MRPPRGESCVCVLLETFKCTKSKNMQSPRDVAIAIARAAADARDPVRVVNALLAFGDVGIWSDAGRALGLGRPTPTAAAFVRGYRALLQRQAAAVLHPGLVLRREVETRDGIDYDYWVVVRARARRAIVQRVEVPSLTELSYPREELTIIRGRQGPRFRVKHTRTDARVAPVETVFAN